MLAEPSRAERHYRNQATMDKEIEGLAVLGSAGGPDDRPFEWELAIETRCCSHELLACLNLGLNPTLFLKAEAIVTQVTTTSRWSS